MFFINVICLMENWSAWVLSLFFKFWKTQPQHKVIKIKIIQILQIFSASWNFYMGFTHFSIWVGLIFCRKWKMITRFSLHQNYYFLYYHFDDIRQKRGFLLKSFSALLLHSKFFILRKDLVKTNRDISEENS